MKIVKLLAAPGFTVGLVAMLFFTSCSSAPKGETVTVAAVQKGVPGGIIIETFNTSATVTGIDAGTRKVTLVTPEGKQTTYKAGPEVINFDQIRIGDQVKATAARELVVFLGQAGSASGDGRAAAIALAPKGDKPGIFISDTVQVTAKVSAIDLKRQKATLGFPDGKSKTFQVRSDVDLTKVKLGEEVVIRATEALAILVERP